MVRHLAVLPVPRYSQLNIVVGFTRTKFIGHHSSYLPLWKHSSLPLGITEEGGILISGGRGWLEDPHGLSCVQIFFFFLSHPE